MGNMSDMVNMSDMTSKQRVLVVDDDPAIRELLRFAFEMEGYEVGALRHGAALLDALTRMDEPCVVLMDLMMPVMDGWAVCRRLEAEDLLGRRHILILMTAAFLPGDEIPAPARALVRKPFDLNAVLDLVARLLGEAPVYAPAGLLYQGMEGVALAG